MVNVGLDLSPLKSCQLSICNWRISDGPAELVAARMQGWIDKKYHNLTARGAIGKGQNQEQNKKLKV